MFAKKFRLPSSVKFSGSPFFTTNFCVIKLKKNDFDFNRYAFIISKKVDKRATARSRAKRLIRSYFERLHPEINKGYDMLVIGRSSLINKTQEEISVGLEGFAGKLHD